MDQEISRPPPLPPLQRHLQLETDLFCFGCGYNLHGQVVTHDERLGFLICRCPECGRFHPAAMGVSASRPWLMRLGVSLIASWILTALTIVGFVSFFIGLMNYAHFESYTTVIYAQRSQGYFPSERHRVLREYSNTNRDYAMYYRDRWLWFAGFSATGSVVLGMFFAVAMWHVSAGKRWLIVGWPILIAVFTLLIWYGNEELSEVLLWSVLTSIKYLLLNVPAMAIGLLIGRPVMRGICRMLVPPKLLQHAQL